MKDNRSGLALVTVVCFASILSILASVLVRFTLTHVVVARKQVHTEKALFAAQSGIEHAAAYLTAGGNVPTAFSGIVGDGVYVVTIIEGGDVGFGDCSVGGQININPNNSPGNEFTVTFSPGPVITRDDLTKDFSGMTGKASFIHVTPKGNGNQNGLMIDGNIYEVQNGSDYDISSSSMAVNIYNDKINKQGKAMGKWWISIAATTAEVKEDGTQISGDGGGPGSSFEGAESQYSIISVGTVNGMSRMLTMEGLRQTTWAKYALWMNDNRNIYFKSGEKFDGHVHSNNQMYFEGDPEFFDDCSSVSTNFGGSTNNVIFHKGFDRGVNSDTMADVDFSRLQSKAGIVVTGATEIVMSTTNLLITNSRRGWNNEVISNLNNKVIYVKDADTGANKSGDASISGVLDGRITVVTDRDIVITDHLKYVDDPKTNSYSDDALGLISKGDVIVSTACPDDVNIYAHILATGQASSRNGSFGVEDYYRGSARGTLTVHGGIVQDRRGAVGTFNLWTGLMVTGFEKNYSYDVRFKAVPPPEYPPLSNTLQFKTWRDKI